MDEKRKRRPPSYYTNSLYPVGSGGFWEDFWGVLALAGIGLVFALVGSVILGTW